MELSLRPHRGGTVLVGGIVGLLGYLLPWKTSQEPSRPEPPTSVSAHILLDDRTIPTGASILLFSPKQLMGLPVFAAEVGADSSTGGLRFEHVPKGKYTIVARWEPKKKRHHGSADSDSGSEAVPATDPVWWGFCADVTPGSMDHEIVLSRGSRQPIFVKTETGEPVEEIRAVLALRAATSFVATPGAIAMRTLTLERHAKTKDGHLVLDGLVPGEWTCVLSVPEYGRTAELSLEVPTDAEREIVVPRFLSVTGEVHAPEGVSVAKVWVGLEYDRTYVLVPEDGQVATYTDESGHFVISKARPAHVTLRASADFEHYMSTTEFVLEPGKDLKDVRIDLTKAK
jgi:hypothetical protein